MEMLYLPLANCVKIDKKILVEHVKLILRFELEIQILRFELEIKILRFELEIKNLRFELEMKIISEKGSLHQ